MFTGQEKIELERLLWIAIRECSNLRDKAGIANATYFIDKIKNIATIGEPQPENAEETNNKQS